MKKSGFYEQVIFKDPEIGFSVKKVFKKHKDKISLLKVGLLDSENLTRRRVHLGAVFGATTEDGVRVRTLEDIKISEPLDIQNSDDYFYDIDEDKIYKG